MFFSEKEKGLNNNYRSAGRGGGGLQGGLYST